MDAPNLINGTISAPYFIFLRCAGECADDEILRMLDIDGHKRNASPTSGQSHLYLTEDKVWTHVADDWYCSLWHSRRIRPAMARVATRFDVFACSVGDTDQSYDFIYYRNAQLVRKYVVEDPHWRGGKVVEDYGAPLPGENEAHKVHDELHRVLFIASLLGVDLRHKLDSIRIYTKARPSRIQLSSSL
jgi:hypothetical protein